MIELPVDGVIAAGLGEQRIGQDFRIADGLGPERPADADKPLLLLGRPGMVRSDRIRLLLRQSRKTVSVQTHMEAL